MKIALCVCTRNRPYELRQALSSVQMSSLLPAQLIVSDDSDEPHAQATRNVCHSFAGVEYHRGPGVGLSANRNYGLDRLSPAIEAVAYIDDDVTVRPDFLSCAASALIAAPKKTIITGRECKNGVDITPHNCSFWGHQEVSPRSLDDYHTIVINTTLFPRALFDEVRFDEALRYGSEEADICAQAEARGFRIRFEPTLINDHHPSPTNRTEYARVVEASRIYSTFKRYLWLERNRTKATVYAVLAPLHLVGSIVKTAQWRHLPTAFLTVMTAAHYARSFNKTQ